MFEKQRTIKKPVSVSGTGLHTGEFVTMTFKPAPENTGYVFKRIDIKDQPLIEAQIENVSDTSRGTTIGVNGVEVKTIEHTLAALSGLSIDNVLIEIDNPELPIMDGSSEKFVSALLEAGIKTQNAPKEYFELDQNIIYSNEERKVRMIALPSDTFKVSVLIDFDSGVLIPQNAILEDINDFAKEIAPCRTFVFLHELEYLVSNDLIKGGDLNNAIVFVNRVINDDELKKLAKLFNKPEVKVLKEGILNNLKLRFHNEPARHKLLDVVGDLALIGEPIKAHIIATRPGHTSNIAFAKEIKKFIRQQKLKKKAPFYDPNVKPVYDINQIKKIIPHRPPFLFVDKILDITDNYIVGLKNVTMNESFFVGHFPSEPILPGVLQVEAMAQAGGVFVLKNVPDPENYATYFLRINNVRFKHKVVPGDTLIFKVELLTPIRRGIADMKGVAFVGEKIAAELEFTAQIVKKEKEI
ncbi:MAG: bifunctional UDP-3-O-[3-hydroxymyristoyl] N-acetylglucosamine deacetylase/3-hydroxyacyl-ACP dehydratase [Bacteroidales bacterium]|nr:bifunctional UDP-3-O-[3-hydroxymyristoyl] N-acetylglucosamine deacetylase/3-hydroxyacyl-ACP dehydratase [Bacteroidales bacterium]